MKYYSFIISKIFILISIIFLLISCNSNKEQELESKKSYMASESFFSSTNIKLTHTSTIVNAVTKELLNTPTLLPPTPTNIPALKASCQPYNGDVEGCVRQLIINNHGCNYPCWWGIDPGHIGLKETNNLMIDLVKTSTPIDIEPFGKGYSYGLAIQEAIIGVSIFGDEFVDIIKLSATIPSPPNELSPINKFHDLLKGYLPRNILLKYGKPTRMYLYLGPSGEMYNLNLVYEDDKFIMSYTGFGVKITSESFSVCPEIWNTRQNIFYVGFASKSDSITEGLEDIVFKFGAPEPIDNTTLETYFSGINKNVSACIEIKNSPHPSHND
jgi:hypothetical protein